MPSAGESALFLPETAGGGEYAWPACYGYPPLGSPTILEVVRLATALLNRPVKAPKVAMSPLNLLPAGVVVVVPMTPLLMPLTALLGVNRPTLLRALPLVLGSLQVLELVEKVALLAPISCIRVLNGLIARPLLFVGPTISARTGKSTAYSIRLRVW